MQRLPVTLCLLFVVTTTGTAQQSDTVKQIDQLFANWSNDTPGGAVMVTRGETVLYNKAFGLADLEHNVPNRTTTIFESGSVSKQFTAMACLLLVKDGKLKLEDDVRKFVPELPAYDAPIRVQHLLNHTSGLKDWGSVGAISGWPRTTRVYTQELALKIICRQKSLNFTPGAEYSYSNSNYTLLAIIAERVSKQPLTEFTAERMFKPAGMNDTKWRHDFQEVVPGRAIAYTRSGQGFKQNMPFENTHGHAGLLTTTSDLTKWNELLTSRAVGGDDVYAMRIKQGKLNNGSTIAYASGVRVRNYNNTLEVSHSGATAGYRAYLLAYPVKQLSIAILSNDGSFNAPRAGNAIAEIFLGKQGEDVSRRAHSNIELDSRQQQQWVGTYKAIRDFDVFDIALKDSKLEANGYTLAPIHQDTLFNSEETYWISKGPGKVMMKRGDDTTTYVKMRPADANARSLQQYIGTYESIEADCLYTIEMKDGNLHLVGAPFGSIELRAVFADGFQIDGYDLIEFRRSSKGAIMGFDLSVSRAERVPFTRTAERSKK